MRFLTPDGRATAVGLLVCGRDPREWLPGSYIQFVRYPGSAIGDIIRDHKEIDGCLSDQLRRLDEVIDANIEQRADLSAPTQQDHPNYPPIALRELARNAVIHRNYELTAAPVRVTWFDDRVEITSPGGPYGSVTRNSFGREGITDYRNPALGDAAKSLGFIQRFGSGIPRAKAALLRNGNPPLAFNVEATYVNVVIQAAR